MNGSLFSITRYMNGVCFKVSGGTSVPKLPPSYPSPLPEKCTRIYMQLNGVSEHMTVYTLVLVTHCKCPNNRENK